ncbi:lysophospholipid acyltransferase family protein [Cupriavidus sp. 2KB_3]|uniref:lysophospholipid acyltransferase family protein n=1 Tax=Cupriavidus sp. 2KB_3 TaxID=3232980 RepID=UPI003F93443F
MIWLRKTRLILLMLRGMLICATVFPWASVAMRERLIRNWSRKLLKLCGVEVEVQGLAPGQAAPRGAMMVANHISWLDIYVIHSWHPARFVAKSEIRSWPVVGWLCEKTGTIFIERGRKRDAHRVLHHITEVMRDGDLVCVFPEGTTTDGTEVLPFHANLMQAPVSGGLPVQPVGLRYLDAATGEPTAAPAYIGDLSLLDSLDMILRSPPIKARLTLGPQLMAQSASRRELAESAREVVVHLAQGTPEAAIAVADRLHQPAPALAPVSAAMN